MANRHDWLSWDQYVSAHDSNLRRFPTFIIEDHLSALITGTGVFWGGRLLCQDGIELHVTKIQQVRYHNGRQEVRTESYSYHALRRQADQVQDILRYDNAHPHLGHSDPHHRHEWNANGEERVRHVGEPGWPTLGDVLEELERWWAGTLLS